MNNRTPTLSDFETTREHAEYRLHLAGGSGAAQYLPSIVNEYLKDSSLSWDIDKGEIAGALVEEDRETAKAAYIEAVDKAAKRIAKWHKKKDIIVAAVIGVSYIGGVYFVSALIKQTHGFVNFLCWIIGFALFFIPWWFWPLKEFIENAIGPP